MTHDPYLIVGGEMTADAATRAIREADPTAVPLWNVWGQVDAARELIGAPGLFSPQALKGHLAA
jgi:hypothetical protein